MSAGRVQRWTAALGLSALLVFAGTVISVAPAGAATITASFSSGLLVVVGDANDNVIVVSRDAAGQLLVNGGAVSVAGGTPTVTNTTMIIVSGGAGLDTLSINEANGALPKAILVGGDGNDTLTGGSGDDILAGQAGNDTLLGKGGSDQLFGGPNDDQLTGGDGDDQVTGDDGNDTMFWNPGDDTDVDEGGAGMDLAAVNGGNGAEVFSETANGTRVRFDRVDPAPFSLDIGTTEMLSLAGNGGNDAFSASGNLGSLIVTFVNGGPGNDTILGTNGGDILVGDADNDFIDGQQGNDLVFLGSGDDTAQWDPGDGSDTVGGQQGVDTMRFNGSNVGERLEASANGTRVRFTRDVASIVMDLNSIENMQLETLGGTDTVTVDDLSGTDLTNVNVDLAGTGGVDDGAIDNVVVNATSGDDFATVAGAGGNLNVAGLHPAIAITGGSAGVATDVLTVNALQGNDIVAATGVPVGSPSLVLNGNEGNDIIVGGDGNDTITGGDGDDLLIGGPGVDIIDGGTGDNTIAQGATAGPAGADAR